MYSDRNMAGQKKKRKELKRDLEEMKIAQIALAQAVREFMPDNSYDLFERAREIQRELQKGNLCANCQKELDGEVR